MFVVLCDVLLHLCWFLSQPESTGLRLGPYDPSDSLRDLIFLFFLRLGVLLGKVGGSTRLVQRAWPTVCWISLLATLGKVVLRLLELDPRGENPLRRFYLPCSLSALVCLAHLLCEPRSAAPPTEVHWSRLLSLGRRQWWLLSVGSAVLLVRLPFSMAMPHFVSEGVGALLHRDAERLSHAIYALLACGTVDALLDFWCVYLFALVQQRVVCDLKTRLFAQILAHPLALFDVQASGDIMSRLTADTGEMANDLSWVFRFSIEALVRITGVGAYMFLTAWQLALLTCTLVPLNSVVNVFYGRWMARNSRRCQDALAASNAVANEAIGNVATVKAFSGEAREQGRFGAALDAYYALQRRQACMSAGYYMLVSTFLMNTLVQAAVVAYGGLLAWDHRMAPEALVAFLLYRATLQEWFSKLLDSYTELRKGAGASGRVFGYLDLPPSVAPTADPAPLSDLRAPPPRLDFLNIHFSYANRPETPVLVDVSFAVPSGSRVALVGPSGSGKSSLLGLLLNLYPLGHGRVEVGGLDVRTLPSRTLRGGLVALVSQEPVLFRGSILDNVLYGLSPNARLADPGLVERCLRTACALSFVTALPGGLACLVGDRGVSLSGGQKQRVAIARALASEPRVLLLDEAMSALDAESEAMVQRALLAAMESRTTLMVSHRIHSVVQQAHWVVVLHNGRVVEQGPPAQLLAAADEEGGDKRRVSLQSLYAHQRGED